MKEVPLTRGKVALVDDEDYERVMLLKWHAVPGVNTWYGNTNLPNLPGSPRPRRSERLHRFILRVTDPKIEVDHRDRNGLNCQRYNLRQATRAQNQANRQGTAKSGFRGVTWNPCRPGSIKGWMAQITVNRNKIHLGRHLTVEEAAQAYDRAALKYFGEFARLNFAVGESDAPGSL
jgi:hypothetical protein